MGVTYQGSPVRWLAPAAVALVLAAGCSSAPVRSGAAAGSPSPAASPGEPASPAPATATPATATPDAGGAPARCTVPSLAVGVRALPAAAGNLYQVVVLTNASGQPCWLYGFPGLLMLDATGRALPTRVVRDDGRTFPGISPTPARVLLAPGTAAHFYLHYSDVPHGAETSCPQARTLLVTPPDETHQLRAADELAPCGGGTIDVSPVLAPGTTGGMGG